MDVLAAIPKLEDETSPMTPLIGKVDPYNTCPSPSALVEFGIITGLYSTALAPKTSNLAHHTFPYISLDSDDVVCINWGM